MLVKILPNENIKRVKTQKNYPKSTSIYYKVMFAQPVIKRRVRKPLNLGL